MLSFKVGSIGFIALCAACFVGCGSDDDGGGSGGSSGSGGSGAQGGSGGGGNGGTGGTSGGAGGSGGTEVTCGSNTCMDANVTGDVTLAFPACCAGDGSACGADVSEAEALIGITGCIELNKAGTEDAACDPISIDVAGNAVDLPGCCQANGKCGASVDVTALGATIDGVNIQGPDFGCQSPTLLGEPEGADCGG